MMYQYCSNQFCALQVDEFYPVYLDHLNGQAKNKQINSKYKKMLIAV